MEGRGGVMEESGGVCEVAKVLHSESVTYIHTDRPSDEPGCRGSLALKKTPIFCVSSLREGVHQNNCGHICKLFFKKQDVLKNEVFQILFILMRIQIYGSAFGNTDPDPT